jgi:hypothetical protein
MLTQETYEHQCIGRPIFAYACNALKARDTRKRSKPHPHTCVGLLWVALGRCGCSPVLYTSPRSACAVLTSTFDNGQKVFNELLNSAACAVSIPFCRESRCADATHCSSVKGRATVVSISTGTSSTIQCSARTSWKPATCSV